MSLFGSIGKAFKSVVKPVVGAVGGTLLNRVVPGAGAIFAQTLAQPSAPQIRAGFAPQFIPAMGRIPPLPRLPTFPGRPGPRPVEPFPMAVGPVGAACPAGFHLAKDGSGRCVKNRRMNPLNPRAFRRAVRRIKGAKRFTNEVRRLFPPPRRRPPLQVVRALPRHEHRVISE